MLHLSSKRPKSKLQSLIPSSFPLVRTASHVVAFNANSAMVEAGLSAGRAMVEEVIWWMDSVSVVLIVRGMVVFAAINAGEMAW